MIRKLASRHRGTAPVELVLAAETEVMVALGVLHIGSTAAPGLALHRWVTEVVEAAPVDER
jgi:GrpB-like predicted nucleotidyltransferase (UPF0157 family)